MKAETQEMTRSEFARYLGIAKSYVTKLAHNDRLVFTADNKRVNVQASLALIRETKDPNRDDVAARHAKLRNAAPERPPQPGFGGNGADIPEEGDQSAARSFSQARAEKEHYLALQARLSYEQQVGRLCEVAAVRELGEDLGVTLREALESQPDQLAPLLAPIQDESKIHAMLVEQFEYVLHGLADRLKKRLDAIMGDKLDESSA